LVPSRPATRMSSSTPPGWNLRYGVMLYTTPLNADHASSSVLCCRQPRSMATPTFLSSSMVTRIGGP
jgi:hypothetical protein